MDIKKYIQPNEKIMWKSSPATLPYMVRALYYVVFGFVWSWFIFALTPVKYSGSVLITLQSFITPLNNLVFVPFALFGIWLMIGMPIRIFLLSQNLLYVITNKRIIIRRGVIKRYFSTITYSQIEKVEMLRDYRDNLSGHTTSSLLIYVTFMGKYSTFDGCFTLLSTNSKTPVRGSWNFFHVDNPHLAEKIIKSKIAATSGTIKKKL